MAVLWVLFLPPDLQKVSDPYIKVEISKLTYKAHRMLIRKLYVDEKTRREELTCDICNTLLPIF